MKGAHRNLDHGAGWRIEHRLFTEWRVGFYASGIAAAYAVAVAWILIRHGFPVSSDGVNCIDFIWVWLSSKLASSGALVQVYDYSAFSAALANLVDPPNCIIEHFDYPPTLLLFTYPLGLMRYSGAFGVWIAATLLLCLAAVYAIIPRRAAVIAAVTSVPVLLNVLLGHNGFLTAGLIGLALALMERRPWLSGIFLGLLTYKPQFGILFPLALLASRNWRAVLSAATTSVMFGLAAALVFGFEAWPSFVDALVDRASSLNEDPTLKSTACVGARLSSRAGSRCTHRMDRAIGRHRDRGGDGMRALGPADPSFCESGDSCCRVGVGRSSRDRLRSLHTVDCRRLPGKGRVVTRISARRTSGHADVLGRSRSSDQPVPNDYLCGPARACCSTGHGLRGRNSHGAAFSSRRVIVGNDKVSAYEKPV